MNKILFRVCFLFLLFIGNMQQICAQPPFHYYKQLGIKEGLSQSKVRCVLNDHKGYLWIGTESGLNRYDRDHLKQYFHHPEDDKTLLSNIINFIVEDSLCNLWVGTTSPAGICLYDRANDNFKTLLDNNGKPIFAHSYVLVEGGILFGGSGCIYKYAYATKQLEICYDTYNDSIPHYVPFREMARYDDEYILLNTQRSGIFSFSLRTNKVKKIESFEKKYYSSIYLDSHKRLWVGVYGDGLYCYQNGSLLKHFTLSNSPLTYNAIHDIIEKDNHLWIATDGGGINIISLDNFSFANILHLPDNVHSFPANSIYCLYLDAGNNIWAGSIRSGLVGIKSVHARSFQHVPFGNMYGLSNQTINRFFQDKDGIIWIGTDGGGINRFDPVSATFEHYPITKHEKIVSMAEYSPNELLYFSFNKGLFILNKHTGQTRPFVLVDKETNDRTCINGFSVYFRCISENKILISAQHIFIYDTETREFEIVATREKDYQRYSPLIIDTVGTKVYLLDLKGICEYDVSTKVFRTIFQGDYTLNDAYMDPDGTFWLASVEGLLHYDPRIGKSRWIKTNLFKEATSVIADRQNRIWIGTRHHLYVYSTKNQNFVALDEVDGVLPNEYIPQATLLAKNGDVLVGGVTGMTLVNPAVHFDTDMEQKIELLDVLLNGLPVSYVKDRKEDVETIELSWDFSSLQLKVLLNENDVFRKNIFRFDIEGFNQELARSNSNSLIINHLPIGEYTITASYYTRDGEWSPKQQVLHVMVFPPWWKTPWFYMGLCLLLGLLIYISVYYFLRKKKIRQRQEMMRLKNKMNEDKVNFLTNISHELRTPLTLICAPLKRIIDRKAEEKDMEKLLTPIYKQAYHMKSIIDMALNVRKLEEGKEVLHILPHSLNEWVRSVGDKFAHELETKEIELEYELDEQIKEVSFDKYKCEFVLSNFLMNALKFSEPGTITTVTTHLSEEGDWVRVSVKDEGMGLSLVDTESLFSNFYQGVHDKGGSGIGLSYAKSLITLHKGKVGALNAQDKGAVFYFELPLLAEASRESKSVSAEKTIGVEMKEACKIDSVYLKKFSVIVIEDTTDLRNYLKEALSHYFDRIYVAKDGKDGLEQIKQHLPDIIISDVMMPRMNGFELCREVKTNLDISHIPFVLLTAYHNSQNMCTGYKTGADAFLPKPFEIDGLLALINNQLKLREQIRLRYKEDNLLTHKEVSFSNADETFLLKLDTLITDNMRNPSLDVTFLASNMCISRSLLFNKVKAVTGMGIIDYVNKHRIDKSIVLLNTTSMNITEISEIAGFSSLRYFSKVFKAIKGEIPSTYRRQDK